MSVAGRAVAFESVDNDRRYVEYVCPRTGRVLDAEPAQGRGRA